MTPAHSSAISRMNVRSRFSISAAWFNLDSLYSCNDGLLADRRNWTGTGLDMTGSLLGKKKLLKSTSTYSRTSTECLSTCGNVVGIERKAVSVKTGSENLSFVDWFIGTFWPVRVSRSAGIDSILTAVRTLHERGEIDLTPASLQENFRNVRNERHTDIGAAAGRLDQIVKGQRRGESSLKPALPDQP